MAHIGTPETCQELAGMGHAHEAGGEGKDSPTPSTLKRALQRSHHPAQPFQSFGKNRGKSPWSCCFIPCLSQPCHTQPGEQLCWRQGRAPIHPCGGWHCQDMLHGKRFYILGVLKCCLLSRTTCDCFYLGKKHVQ